MSIFCERKEEKSTSLVQNRQCKTDGGKTDGGKTDSAKQTVQNRRMQPVANLQTGSNKV